MQVSHAPTLTSASHSASHLTRFGRPVAPLLPPHLYPHPIHTDLEKCTPLYGGYCAFGMTDERWAAWT